MPTLFIMLGFRFYFFANDHEPIHVHVEKGGAKAVFQVEPEKSRNMKSKDLVVAEGIAEERRDEIITEWKKFFKNQES